MKRNICIAGIMLGVILMIVGVVVLTSFESYVPSLERFGADFYTYSYDATRAAAMNVARLGNLIETALGVLLLALGAGTVLLSLYGYANCREATNHSATPQMMDWLKSKRDALSSGLDNTVEWVKSSSGAASNWLGKFPQQQNNMWICTCGTQHPLSKGTCDACGAMKPSKKEQPAAVPVKKVPDLPYGTWTCTCGAQWPAHRGTCENCGERKPK